MHFDVPKVVRSPGCDHGHDEESRNGRYVKIHILDDMVRPRGQAHGAISQCKRSFAGKRSFVEARGPNAGDPGVWPWARRRGPWRLGQTPRIVAFGPGVRVGLLPFGQNRL